MAIVLLDTQTFDFTTGDRVDFGPFIHREDRAFMYFLEATNLTVPSPQSYLVVNSRFANSGDNVRSPMICKFFPTQTKMGFLLKVPRIRDTNNQQVLIQCLPKKFYPNAVGQDIMDISLFWEDDQEYSLDDGFPN